MAKTKTLFSLAKESYQKYLAENQQEIERLEWERKVESEFWAEMHGAVLTEEGWQV